jgi:hypothetical protein
LLAYIELWGAIRAGAAAEHVSLITQYVTHDVYPDRHKHTEHTDPYLGMHDVVADNCREEAGEIALAIRHPLERIEAGLDKLGTLEDPADRFMAVFVRTMRAMLDEDAYRLFAPEFCEVFHNERFSPDWCRKLLAERQIPQMHLAATLKLMAFYMAEVLAGGNKTLNYLKTAGELPVVMPSVYEAPPR